jgi:RAV-like factor
MTTTKAMKADYSTEHKQDNEVSSAMTEEFTSSFTGFSENGRQQGWEEGQFKDWILARSRENNFQGLERLGSGMSAVARSDGESDEFEDLRRYSLMSMQQASKLPSSQYKSVVTQPNGRWGTQIYQKHQRVWLGTFNREHSTGVLQPNATAYDRAALQFRDLDAMTNFSPAGGGNPEALFTREHTKEEIVDMLRKHNYDEEFEHHSKRINLMAAWSATMNNEPPGSDGSGQRESGTNWPDDRNGNDAMASFLREHLFDKVVTPSDVGKRNRLVLPKLHAEKYFPLAVDSTEKGPLLNFQDNTGKVWRFRYSYWKSSQSYVLTKGWNLFVKDKKLEVGDIVSFHRGSSAPHQLYISWRNRPSGQPLLRVGPQSRLSKEEVMYPVKGSLSLNSSNSGTQATVFTNNQWMPSSSNPDAFTQFNSNSIFPPVNKVGHLDDLWSHIPATPLNGAFPFCFSAAPAKQTAQGSFYEVDPDGLPTIDLYLNLHNSLNSGDGSTNIKQLHPFVNPVWPSAAQELEAPEQKATSNLDPATKKGVRLFGVTLAES